MVIGVGGVPSPTAQPKFPLNRALFANGYCAHFRVTLARPDTQEAARLTPRTESRIRTRMAEIAKVRYTHDAMIDFIVANPMVRQREIAAFFGMTEAWISQVFSSDVFKMRLHKRKEELVDPLIQQTLEENFEALMRQSIQVVREKLEMFQSPDLAIEALKVASRASGFGARNPAPTIQNQVIVMVPPKLGSSADWAEAYQPPLNAAQN